MPMKGPMPMKDGAPSKSEGKQGGSMDMQQMKEMHGKMMQMKKAMAGIKSEDMMGMGGMMQHMSGMMGEMGHMMQGDKMTPEQKSEMSKMMGGMSGMMKQMSDRMKTETKKTQ